MFAIAYSVDGFETESFVKMRKQVIEGREYWDVSPVPDYEGATKWREKWMAEKTIRNTDSFSFPGVTAIVVTQ